MKKIVMCLVAFVTISAFAAEEFKFNTNTTDKAVIKSYQDALAAGTVSAKNLGYITRMVPVLAALADVDGNISYTELKEKIYIALDTVPNLKEKKINVVGSVLGNIKRFQTPALRQAYVNDLMTKKEPTKWAVKYSIRFKGLTAAQYIWLFETGMIESSKPAVALDILTRFEKNVGKLPANIVLNSCKKVKRAIYSRISDEAWKPVLVKLELMIQSLQ